MKLPNIQYKQRKPLAKIDPSMFVALGRAQAQGLEAIGSAGEAIGSAVQDVYDRESVSQMQDAYLNYSEQMDRYSQEQKSQAQNEDTGESEGSWINGTQRFDNYERELRDNLNKKLTSPLARRLFAEKANVQNVQNKKMNNAQLGTWQKEHEIAGVHTRLNRQVANKKFDDARATIVEAVTVDSMGEVEGAKQLIGVNYEEKNHTYAAGADLIQTAQDAIDYEKRLRGSGLKSTDINRHLGTVDDTLVNKFREKMNNVILDAENVNGSKAEGYAAGRKYLDSLMRTKANKVGRNEQAKELAVSASNTILNRYKGAVEKQTVESKRTRSMDDLEAGNIMAAEGYNETAYADIFNDKWMNWQRDGAKGYKKNFDHPIENLRAVTDKEFLNNDKGVMNRFVDYSAEGGHMPNTGRATIRAALTHGDSEQGAQAVAAISALWRKNPFAVLRNGENDDFADVAVYAELMGGAEGSDEAALKLWRKTSSMSDEQRKLIIGSRTDNDTYFEENIGDVIEEQFPQEGGFFSWFTNSDAKTKRVFEVNARALMDKYKPAYPDNNKKALTAAVVALKGSYGGTGVNGGFSIMKNAPEDTVINGKKNGGVWLREQFKDDIKKQFGEDANVEEFYTEAVDNFSATDPAWNVFRSVDGMVQQVGVTKYDYTKAGEYIENKENEIKEREAIKRITENKRLRMEQDINDPPETRKMTRAMARGRSSKYYGRDTSKLNPLEELLFATFRGSAARTKSKVQMGKLSKDVEEKRAKQQREADAEAGVRRRKLGRRRN